MRILRVVAVAFVPLAAFAQINSNFFGLAISGQASVAWPNHMVQSLPLSAVRLWDSGTRWDQLETGSGVFAWGQLDRMLSQAQAHNQTVLYTFGGVPSFISTHPSDVVCGEGNGSCDPPNDVNPDGSGTDAQFQAFVTALMIHTGKQINYFEPWNEVNNTQFWTGTAAQMVRMVYDARAIIKAYNPSAIVLTPSTCSCNNVAFTAKKYASSDPSDGLRYYLEATANVAGLPSGASLADGIAIHPYVGNNPPENILTFITNTQSAMKAAGMKSLPLWITEDSWGPNINIDGCASSAPFDQACLDTASAFLARSFALAASQKVAAYYWYAWGNNTHGTLYNPSAGALYEQGSAFAQISNWLTGSTSISPCSNIGTVYTCQFARPGGFHAMLVWDAGQNCKIACTTSTFTVPIGFTTEYDLAGDPPTSLGSTTEIGIKPVLLTNIACKITNPMCGLL